MKLLFILLIFLIQNVCGINKNIPFDYSFLIKLLNSQTKNRVEFTEIYDAPITYQAWGIWNFPFPASKVAEVALDFKNYPKIFKNVYRCDLITEPPYRVSKLGTYYVEGRAAFARVWAIGDIDTIVWQDSSFLKFIAHQNEDRLLEARWSYFEKRWLNYRTHGVKLAAFIVGNKQDSCRLGIVVRGWVTKRMPSWLVKMAIEIILPQLLMDLENEVSHRNIIEQKKKKINEPWYKQIFNKIRDFIFF
jgi:hypothetical protein